MSAKRLSKSRYTAFCQCPKNLWLKVNKPEEAVVDDATQARFEQGNEVGDLAVGLFGEYKEAHAEKPDGGLDLAVMTEQTCQWMNEGVENICEASFIFEGNYCAVDILRRNGDGWDIYEVKSSSFPEYDGKEAKLEKYAPDIAYQKWVLTQCGVEVKNTFLVCLNSNYVRHGELDIKQLFAIIDMKELVDNEYLKVPTQVKLAMNVLSDGNEPDIDLDKHCMKPYKCAFLDYCKRQHGVPEDELTAFDLYNMKFSEKLKYYHAGRISFEDVLVELQNKMSDPKYIKKPTKTLPIQQMQVECTLNHTEHIDKNGIREFLSKLSYPLYFLDFETMQDAVPRYDNAKVYAQIPFQYSLHIKRSADADYEHREFLAPSDGSDPRRALAERLCSDIPMNACTFAYNKSFECSRIKELASLYPDLAAHLLNIEAHIQDLLEPFQDGYYYVPAMGGSFSIKSVLPALFPDEPTLNYHNLDERCQNGGDAMNLFPAIAKMPPEEAEAARKSLLEYCKLDTWAMVKVWERLREV